jgi:lipopolysaccharide export LptBFGC system permease protein LptF
MADWQIRKTNLEMNLGTSTALVTEFQERHSRSVNESADKTELQGKMQMLKSQQSDIQAAIETYEKEFLDRKNGAPVSYAIFQTLQDWVLLFFFVSFLLLSLVFIYSTLKTKGAMATGTLGVVTFLLVFIFVEAIRRFG